MYVTAFVDEDLTKTDVENQKMREREGRDSGSNESQETKFSK
jgi:hypothetical protein